MRVYNPKDWFSLFLRPRHSPSVGLMACLLIAVCLFVALVVYIEQDVLKLPVDHPIKNALMLQTFLGFAISNKSLTL